MHFAVQTWARRGARTALALALAAGLGAAWAHGDVTPQPMDTRTLPPVASTLSVMMIPVIGVFIGAYLLREVLHWQDWTAVALLMAQLSGWV